MAKNTEPDKLAQESTAALAAGMSYGKWKAMQNPVTIVKKDEIPDGWCVCQWCGKPFRPKIKRVQKFCESECQRQAFYARSKEKAENSGAENDPFAQQ